MGVWEIALLVAAGFGGGMAAAMAGGASLITFPLLLGLGLSPVAANATNFVGLSLSNSMAVLADWRRRPSWGRAFSWLVLVNFIGGALGALLMLETPADLLILLVPGLIGMATLLFAIGPWLRRSLAQREGNELHLTTVLLPCFLAAIYGGYFGAALGIITLAILSVGGMTDMRSANVLKNILVTATSASSVWIFIWQGAVNWPAAIALLIGSTIGAYAGGLLIRVLPPWVVRTAITLFGATATIIYGYRYWIA